MIYSVFHRSLYNQLVKDTSHEKYDERRVNMLKCQIVQLERQVGTFWLLE